LKRGFVLVGNLPTTDGTSSTVQQGSLLILNSAGVLIANLTDATLLDGPWDLAIHDEGSRAQAFVSNVLNGTVTRLDLSVTDTAVTVSSSTRIASGYTHRFDPAALVIGATGLAYDTDHDVLYVASTGDNKVFAIDHARAASKDSGTGRVVYTDNVHLHGPLGLALAPNGDLITANGDAVNAGGMQNDWWNSPSQDSLWRNFRLIPALPAVHSVLHLAGVTVRSDSRPWTMCKIHSTSGRSVPTDLLRGWNY
jgi:DNA-binding beta-propeller fold protein YncE